MKTVFRVGDKVFDIHYGWGVVDKICDTWDYPVYVKFLKDIISYTLYGEVYSNMAPTLSFTEYTLQGFSQERPVVLPEVGELVLVRDNDSQQWRTASFVCYKNGLYHCFMSNDSRTIPAPFTKCKRFKFIEE
jgi:hypothetical protein